MTEPKFWELYNALVNTRKEFDVFSEALGHGRSELHPKKEKVYDLLGDLLQMLCDSPDAPACVKDEVEEEEDEEEYAKELTWRREEQFGYRGEEFCGLFSES